MATVSYLMQVCDSLLVKFDKRFADEQIVLLEEAKWEVWKLLISYNRRSNWFMKIGAQFNITNGDYDYTLPTDLAQLRKLVPVNEADRHYVFYKDDEESDRFQELERLPNARPYGIPYTVIGEEPGTLLLAATPQGTVPVKPHYVYKPPVIWARRHR